MNKQPKFFCENCNAEVRRNAAVCPHCGRFFASVRCPHCGFTGRQEEFKNGCPSCGYALSQENANNESVAAKKRKKRNIRTRQDSAYALHTTDSDPLPLWIYGIVLLLSAALAVLFFFSYHG